MWRKRRRDASAPTRVRADGTGRTRAASRVASRAASVKAAEAAAVACGPHSQSHRTHSPPSRLTLTTGADATSREASAQRSHWHQRWSSSSRCPSRRPTDADADADARRQVRRARLAASRSGCAREGCVGATGERVHSRTARRGSRALPPAVSSVSTCRRRRMRCSGLQLQLQRQRRRSSGDCDETAVPSRRQGEALQSAASTSSWTTRAAGKRTASAASESAAAPSNRNGFGAGPEGRAGRLTRS